MRSQKPWVLLGHGGCKERTGSLETDSLGEKEIVNMLRSCLPVLGLAALLAWGGAAQATPMSVILSGTIASHPVELDAFIADGDPFSLEMSVDSGTANEGVAPDFLATDPGSVYSYLIVDITGTLGSVAATAGSGAWSATGLLDILGTPLPYAISLTGSGLTPGQILPDFTSFTGSITIDLSSLVPGAYVVANVDSIAIAPVPEPATALFLFAGLTGLAAAGKRRRA